MNLTKDHLRLLSDPAFWDELKECLPLSTYQTIEFQVIELIEAADELGICPGNRDSA